MRKLLIREDSYETHPTESMVWLDLENHAQVELTSEDEMHPIESALAMNIGAGWRASEPGKQTIRFIFDQPRTITRIKLLFYEDSHARTQEFVLRWSADSGTTYHEIARQQYNLGPPDTTREVEDYFPTIVGVTTLELIIIPHISGGDTRASLAQLLIAE